MSLEGIPIITYHAVEEGKSPVVTSPEVFQAQITALVRQGYEAVTVTDVIEWVLEDKPLPGKTVALTFDDGYASVYEHAWPYLRTFGWKATVFLVSDYCGGDNQWPGQSASVPKRPLLTWEQASELASDGWEFGAHTRNHPPLPLQSELQIEDELAASQSTIREKLGQEVRSFAYPYGATNPQVRAMVRRCFDGAVGARLGLVYPGSDVYELERIDAFYLMPTMVPGIGGRIFRGYLRMRQMMRDVRRHVMPDWKISLSRGTEA